MLLDLVVDEFLLEEAARPVDLQLSWIEPIATGLIKISFTLCMPITVVFFFMEIGCFDDELDCYLATLLVDYGTVLGGCF